MPYWCFREGGGGNIGTTIRGYTGTVIGIHSPTSKMLFGV